MFRFEHSFYLYALLLLPVLAGFFLLMRWRRKRRLRRLGNTELLKRLMPEMSRYVHSLKFGLLLLALALLIIGWANPQWGSEKQQVKRQSVDIMIALDLSLSMRAVDISPNRLERAKRLGLELLDRLEGERLGLIIFAGNAYLQVPMTTDYAHLANTLRSANTNMVSAQGTALSAAIELAGRSFEEDNKHHKALVVISDGENHDQEALDAAGAAQETGLVIYTVGVGTKQGSFIPVTVAGQQDYKRDQSGKPVRSVLNEALLKGIAEAADGQYYQLAGATEPVLNALAKGIGQLEKRELEQLVYQRYNSYFQYFLAAGLIVLVLEFLAPYRRIKYLSGRDPFKVE